MAADQGHPTATEMDYPAHNRNYSGFLKLLKWSIVVVGIITVLVMYIIAN